MSSSVTSTAEQCSSSRGKGRMCLNLDSDIVVRELLVTLISGMVILVSGFLSSIRKTRFCSASLTFGLHKNTAQLFKNAILAFEATEIIAAILGQGRPLFGNRRSEDKRFISACFDHLQGTFTLGPPPAAAITACLKTRARSATGCKSESQLTFPLKLFRASESVSGAMNAGVPAVLDSIASLPSNWLLTPKSAIFTWPSSPSSKLEGLMSRWTIFW
ncbi:hypothetical protein EYF80_025062 [Liparis tanakae]|uniref:Uncharacterized protein n=1 Tax=Liparis tanakae TaxID=230148 RepID=A0A4Z2HGA2_9TELE|nr:hypothetical protein EYF80_025062 [Liparis tanakae]